MKSKPLFLHCINHYSPGVTSGVTFEKELVLEYNQSNLKSD